MNIDTDKFKCWVCDYSGRTIRRLVKTYGDFRALCDWDELTNHVDINSFDDLFKVRELEPEQRIFLPVEFRTLTDKMLPLHAMPVKKYLSVATW